MFYVMSFEPRGEMYMGFLRWQTWKLGDLWWWFYVIHKYVSLFNNVSLFFPCFMRTCFVFFSCLRVQKVCLRFKFWLSMHNNQAIGFQTIKISSKSELNHLISIQKMRFMSTFSQSIFELPALIHSHFLWPKNINTTTLLKGNLLAQKHERNCPH